MIPVRSLSRVLLPAPLGPIKPITSPCLTSKETSFKAQMVSGLSPTEDGGPETEDERPGAAEQEREPLDELVDYIDWTPFFQVWELRGRYPDI